MGLPSGERANRRFCGWNRSWTRTKRKQWSREREREREDVVGVDAWIERNYPEELKLLARDSRPFDFALLTEALDRRLYSVAATARNWKREPSDWTNTAAERDRAKLFILSNALASLNFFFFKATFPVRNYILDAKINGHARWKCRLYPRAVSLLGSSTRKLRCHEILYFNILTY